MPYFKNIPIPNDFSGQAVFISGGTRGIGLAIGIAFAKLGAQLFLTHRWGSAKDSEVIKQFSDINALPPVIIEADASQIDENRKVIEEIQRRGLTIAAFISCVCVVTRGNGIQGMSNRIIRKVLEYSSWPFVQINLLINALTGQLPRYSLAISSDGHYSCYPGYDNVAMAKSVMEALLTPLAEEFSKQGAQVNIIRTRSVLTESYHEIFAEEDRALVQAFDEFTLQTDDIASIAIGLCSGYLDSVNGKIIIVDKGAHLVDNLMWMGPSLLKNSHAK